MTASTPSPVDLDFPKPDMTLAQQAQAAVAIFFGSVIVFAAGFVLEYTTTTHPLIGTLVIGGPAIASAFFATMFVPRLFTKRYVWYYGPWWNNFGGYAACVSCSLGYFLSYLL